MLGFGGRRKKIEILEKELKTYQMYIKPLEELVKEIRARQHEFDNHMNAILNMHYTIHDYDELVKAQSKYIQNMYRGDSRQLIGLLRISDKILAGFLYSKIISAKPYIKVDVDVRSLDIVSSISEHSLIEIIGTLVDNAFEAATEEFCNIGIVLDAMEDKMVFEIKNEVRDLTLEKISHFFDKGYTTKNEKTSDVAKEKHGFGLYNARNISKKYGGDLTVDLEDEQSRQFITFRLEI